MNDQINKLPTSYWIIAVVGLIWNLMGVMNFFGQTFMSDETMASLPEAQQELFQSVPLWMTIVFAIAVFTGTLGCIGLLLKKAWAVPLFLISLVTIVIQMSYSFLITDYADIMGITSVIVMISIFVIAAVLYFYSTQSKKKGWIS